MHLFFIDESGTIPPKEKMNINYFTLGGIIIPEDLWHEINNKLNKLKDRFCIRGEIKWRYFSPQKIGKKGHSLSHLTPSEKQNLRNELFQIIAQHNSIRLISVLVAVEAGYKLQGIKHENDLYWHAYKQLAESFHEHLKDLSLIIGSKIHGIIICDHRQPKDDDQLRKLHQDLLTEAHLGLNYQNLIEGVFIAPSHLSVGIQLADMVAGAVYRKFVRNDSRYWDQVSDSFRRSSNGKIEGYGLIKWPEAKTPRWETPIPASIDAVTA